MRKPFAPARKDRGLQFRMTPVVVWQDVLDSRWYQSTEVVEQAPAEPLWDIQAGTLGGEIA